MGCVMAALVLETTGTQEYTFDPADFLTRLASSYGTAAADEAAASMSRTSRVPTHVAPDRREHETR
jgi:adenosine kinase